MRGRVALHHHVYSGNGNALHSALHLINSKEMKLRNTINGQCICTVHVTKRMWAGMRNREVDLPGLIKAGLRAN